ncbi:putative dehydrogenase [Paenibacillus sp. V4I3]|uniref:Gfo/Idh/MocA family protein n=1 Tax=unclassified Paenibacillus TaxID=185978 RepID=UPI00277FACA8|nr:MULTISPECIES: Gfo/Idh/MocA family oxidoreductase [unclassified Paenibacillus]MDQ0873573.1 putative dehydrogenase [Paenibacillus sp. V4I3]MDQ0890496.1 putative dehydrogenase [Paenibacillus sp. V4I9]
MLQKLRLAVVGLGRVSKSHLPAVRELTDKIELVALVTRDEGKLQSEAEKWEGVKTYTSYDDAVNDPNIDAFLLLLPHDIHAEYSIKALRAGKHVLVEKPMAMNVQEAEEMAEAAEANNVTLMIGQSRRFYKPVMESIRQVREKAIGDLININAMLLAHMDKPAADWWKDESKIGGFIIPLWGSHILDYMLWAYGRAPQSVYAQGHSNNPNWMGEDEVAISMNFGEGRMANVWMSFNAGCRPTDEDGLTGKRIWSTQNSIYDRYLIGSNGLLHLKDEYELSLNGEKLETCETTFSNFTWQLEEFTDAIREGRQPLASGREIIQVMKVIDGCFESMRTGQVVQL